ncbi:MAG: hypothetical protein HQL53_13375, partial [Magnetococcales bacterium]|nr:hypothetical protein [Magnetococcales bacterium]
MPVIEPVSIEECIEFAENSREDIVEGVYDIKILPEWLDSLPTEVVTLLVTHCDASKSVIARTLDPETGGLETLMKLAEDDEQTVRKAIAANPKTPAEALKKLSF